MPKEVFEVSLSHSVARKFHKKLLGDLEAEYPWESLHPNRYPEVLISRARLGWTENAFNEFCTAAAMGQLVQVLGQARVPLDLWSMASSFAQEELLHVELCSRMAMRLGGGAPILYDPENIVFSLDPTLSPLERANELVVRLCCVGEAFSFPMLSGCMRSATHPLTKAILTKIVKDEALHGKFGWLYLDWIKSELKPAERERLGRAAAQTLKAYRPLWEKLKSKVVNGKTTEGFSIEHVHELGWMEASAYTLLAEKTITDEVLGRLSTYGILAPLV